MPKLLLLIFLSRIIKSYVHISETVQVIPIFCIFVVEIVVRGSIFG